MINKRNKRRTDLETKRSLGQKVVNMEVPKAIAKKIIAGILPPV